MNLDLNKIRQDINAIDRTLVECFEQRMEIVRQVAAYKKAHRLPIIDTERERQVIENNCALLHNPEYSCALQSVLEKIMSVSRNMQQTLLSDGSDYAEFQLTDHVLNDITAGYQGVAGSFSQQALRDYFQCYQNITERSFLTFEELFAAVSGGEIEYGVLPIENSSTGAVTEIYDLLKNYEVCIIGEHYLKISQCLLAKPGTTIADIQKVYSHPQGFKQSAAFLQQYPHWEQIPYFNTAKSAQYVAETPDKHIAAIAGSQVANLYDLTMLEEQINFNTKNYTRFIVIGRQKELLPASDKISLIISLPHKAGSLARVLNYFEEEHINLLKLESRPDQEESWAYYFYIDFTGNIQEKNVVNALNKLRSDSLYFKILGNYPRHKEQ